MTQSQVSIGERAADRSIRENAASRYFYAGAACLMAILAFAGFRRFYLEGLAFPGREIAPPIKALVVAHAISMTLWLVLLIIQPLLIRTRRHRIHMKLGRLGAVLAVIIFGLGLWLAIRSMQVTPPEALIFGLPPAGFMAVPFFSILIFGIFVVLGIVYRRRPNVHRSMMLLATLNAIGAAVSRVESWNNLYVGTVWERLLGPFLITLLIGVLLLAVRCVLKRSVDRPFAIGLATLIIASFAIMLIARTSAWEAFATLFVS